MKLWLSFLVLLSCWACVSAPDSRPPSEGGVTDLENLPADYLDEFSRPADPPPTGFLDNATLEDYLRYAEANNPALQGAFLRWKAALEKIPQVRALPDPRFTYAYFINEVETRAGPQRHRFGLSQVFPWLGKLRLRGNAAGEESLAAKERFPSVRNDLRYRIKEAYHEYAYLAQAIAVTEENLALLSDLEKVAQTWYAVGGAPHADLIRAQVELGKLEDRLTTLHDLRGPTMARLNAYLNLPAEAPLPWPSVEKTDSVSLDEELLAERLRKESPELRALDHLVAREARNRELARKGRLPDITVGLEVIETDEALAPSTPDSGKDPVIASISLNLPVQLEKYRAGEREARAEGAALAQERRDRENRLLADLKLALYGYRNADRKMELYESALLPKAEQSLGVTLQSYETGESMFSDLMDALETLLEFRLAYERAAADRAIRLAEVEKLAGGSLAAVEKDRPEEDETPTVPGE